MNDDFGTFLKFERAKQQHGNEPAQIADYPEHVVETLRVFNRVWCPPPLAIPNKRQKSKFKQWVSDLEYLEDLCGTNKRFEQALQQAVKVYREKNYTFIVDTPLKFKNMITTALAQMNQTKQGEFVAEEKVIKTDVDKKESLRMFDALKNSLVDGDDDGV